jgi:protoporphyrinogen oxidase
MNAAATPRQDRVVIVGGGPAGLTAAYVLMKAGRRSLVLERYPQLGGHARTLEHRGFLFDVGGHRFFTRIPEVEALWREVMEGEGLLEVQRLSRILYRGRLFRYPLRPLEALSRLGLVESARVVLSYARARLLPSRDERTLEQWMCNRFGRRLYLTFFKTYTEKVWGMPCSEIRAEWAAQRIKTLTLGKALRNALLPGGEAPRSLVERFHYPAKGPGMLWERLARRLCDGGQEILTGRDVARVRHAGDRIQALVARTQAGVEEEHAGCHFIASMPLRDLVLGLDPPAPEPVRERARALRYRDFVTVALMLRRREVFPDNWIYIHSPEVRVARVQNYKNWSRAMVPDPETTCLGMEYFCSDGDPLWSSSDAELVRLARSEAEALGFAARDEVFDAAVLRQPRAYPVYDAGYRDHLDALRDYLARFANLEMVGRNGLHQYNNQDHAMLTAMLAARNVLGEELDVWAVNTEQEYQEAWPERAG